MEVDRLRIDGLAANRTLSSSPSLEAIIADNLQAPFPALSRDGPLLGRLVMATPPTVDNDIFRDALLISRIWRLVPTSIRLAMYFAIWRACDKLFPRYLGQRVRPLLPGIYLKRGGLRPAEAHAMARIRRHTNERTSIVLDYIPYHNQFTVMFPDQHPLGFILMTAVPGAPLGAVAHTLSSNQIETIGEDLRIYLNNIRRIPNPYQHSICSAAGDGLDAPRITFDFGDVPTCDDTKQLHAWIRERAGRFWPHLEPYAQPLWSEYDERDPVFTHGDLSPDNIMVYRGRFSGLIDWETSGWLPAYWEYFSARWRGSEVCKRIVKLGLPEQNDQERLAMVMAAAITHSTSPEEWANVSIDY